MKEMTRARALLFESGGNDERLRIECSVHGDGHMDIVQESDGPVTDWCFEEGPHAAEVLIAPDGVARLVEHYALDDASQLPAALQMQFAGVDASLRVRDLLDGLGIPFEVVERSGAMRDCEDVTDGISAGR